MSGWDAIVIGGGSSGLIAAATLAKARQRTLLLEARNVFGGTSETPSSGEAISLSGFDPVLALDQHVIEELKLNLRYVTRDLPLVALRPEGHHIVVGRDAFRTARNLAWFSARDAQAWPHFRREVWALARAMRRLWWPQGTAAVPVPEHDTIEAMKYAGAAAWLGRWFESEALKAALAFDATEDGAAVNAPPSALILLWRLAQEMSGLQAAQAIVDDTNGGLAGAALRAALAAGAELRNSAPVTEILISAGRASGVRLANGETIDAGLVLSSLSRSVTQALLPIGAFGLSHPESAHAPPIGTARVLLSFDREPRFGDDLPTAARFVVADRIESLVAARDMSLAGAIPDELVFDAVPVAPRMSTAQYALLLRIRPVPIAPSGGWDAARAVLAARAVSALGTFDRSLKSAVVALRIATPQDVMREYGKGSSAATVERLLQPAGHRITTPVENLLLCGPDAEPVSDLAGRAARLAARRAVALAGAKKKAVLR
jgi:phytoene dehydrogenase-like protein